MRSSRSLLRLLGLSLALGASVAWARPPSVQKAIERQDEASEQVQSILAGNVISGVARLHYLGEESFAAALLIKELGNPDPAVRRNIAQALAQLHVRQSEDALIQLTRDEDGSIRMSAVDGLGRIHSRALKRVQFLLRDKTLGVRREAARALGGLHQSGLGPSLMAAARRETEPDARAEMLIAVGESGDRRQVHALETFLTSTSESSRLAAAQALCHLGAPAGLNVARAQLASKEPLDRRHGVELFEGVNVRISGKLLRPMLHDPDGHVAALAARTLFDGGDPHMVDWLVLASAHAQGQARFPFEDQLEQLQITPEQRKAILRKAGVR